jgi:hypothetical protein
LPRSASDRRSVRTPDEGTALFSTAIGVLVVLLFLLFAVQLLFSLYANSTITAVVNDAAQRAATQPVAARDAIEAEARHSLGDVGADASFEWGDADSDGDGEIDTVVLAVIARPPRFLPRAFGDRIGLTEVTHTARARTEQFG